MLRDNLRLVEPDAGLSLSSHKEERVGERRRFATPLSGSLPARASRGEREPGLQRQFVSCTISIAYCTETAHRPKIPITDSHTAGQCMILSSSIRNYLLMRPALLLRLFLPCAFFVRVHAAELSLPNATQPTWGQIIPATNSIGTMRIEVR